MSIEGHSELADAMNQIKLDSAGEMKIDVMPAPTREQLEERIKAKKLRIKQKEDQLEKQKETLKSRLKSNDLMKNFVFTKIERVKHCERIVNEAFMKKLTNP